MRIDPAQRIEMEMTDLKKKLEDLKQQCNKYFALIEEIKPARSGWQQQRSCPRYGDKF
jgi:hypothetical protein